METAGNTWQYEETFKSPHDFVNVKVTPGDSKAQDRQKGGNKMEKNGTISTEIERFQLERTAFCNTNIINMDAGILLPDKKYFEAAKTVESDFLSGVHPPPSPRSKRDL